MKNPILYFAATLLLGGALLAGSCTKEVTTPTATEPNFPTMVTPSIPTGGEYLLEIEPNLYWELSIPFSGDAAKWFYIKDGTLQSHKIQGNAGKQTISICAQDQSEYDKQYSCDVTLKMWDAAGNAYTRVIATITTGKIERKLQVYACRITDGDFAYATEEDRNQGLSQGNYETTPTKAISLFWPIGKNGFSMPIMVDANFQWNVVSKLPEWISDLTVSGGKGDRKIDFRITGNSMKYPLDGATTTLELGTQEQRFALEVTIPACRDMFESELAKGSKFNELGHVYVPTNNNYQEGTSYGMLVSAGGVKFYKLMEVTQSGRTQLSDEVDTSWISLKDSWRNSGEVVQSRRIDIGVTSTTGDPRKAVIVALPATIAATIDEGWQLLDETQNAIAPQYKKYIVTTITQAGHPGPISASQSDQVLTENSAAFKKIPMSDQQYNWLKNEFEATHIYRQTYAANWGNEGWNLVFATPYASFKRFNYNASGEFEELTAPNVWLDFVSDKWSTNIMMRPLQNVKSEGAVVFYNDKNEAIATIYCIFDKDADIGGGDDDSSVEFLYPNMVQNATLTKVVEGSPYYNEYIEYIGMGTPVYHLAYTGSPSTAMFKTPAFVSTSGTNEWLTFEGDASSVYVNMNATESKEGLLMFYGASGAVLVLVCTLEK